MQAVLRKMGRFDGLVFVATLLSALALALSGFSTVLTSAPMTSWVLLGHVAAGAVFLTVSTVLALLWAEACTFGVPCDTAESCDGLRFGGGRRFFFWCLMAGALGTAVTTVLSMVPLFATSCMDKLSCVHYVSALLVVIAAFGAAVTK